ncbi:MAG: zinc permease, partial [Candidatus Nanohaloarchaea archaeon]
LHNITEGFSIAAPIANMRSGLKLLGALGLVAGGPVFIGAMVGQVWTSEPVSVLFMALAGGALIYVIDGVLRMTEGMVSRTGLYASIVVGILVALATELVVKAGMMV